MKIAGSSRTFARALASGELTQLEWLDIAATELDLDGVVLDAAHFPRTDDEYLAQIKKLAVDTGLTLAAVECAMPFAGDGARWLGIAAALGAPILIGGAPAANADAGAWNAFVAAARDLAGAAKRANVTLGVRNAPPTLCPGTAELARLAKDCDSSWLRYALAPSDTGPSDDVPAALGKCVAVLFEAAAGYDDATREALAAVMTAVATVRAFRILDAPGAADPASSLAAMIADARRMESSRGQ